MISSATTVITLCSMFVLASATIPSMGMKTTESERAKLKDSDYLVEPRKGRSIKTPAFTAYIATNVNSPAMTLADVQYAVGEYNIMPGNAYRTHYHPRGAELITVMSGTARVSFTQENGKNVTNTVRRYHTSVIPQGLVHTISCVGERRCRISVVINTADPGAIFV